MDETYPVINSLHDFKILAIAEMYLISALSLGFIIACRSFCVKESGRIYRNARLKNTDESPIINA